MSDGSTNSTDEIPEVSRTKARAPELRKDRFFSFGTIVVILLTAVLSAVAFVGWTHLYTHYLETTPPEIIAAKTPPGIGLAPVSVEFNLFDNGAGLDEVVVRTKQRAGSKEVLRQPLGGKASHKVIIDFPGDKSDLEEGPVEIEVKAFDRSFWNNSFSRSITLNVDFHRPRIEVLTTQHNAREGGCELVFYRALDERLSFSGVRIGKNTFAGFPARGIDRAFEDKNLFAALYAVDMRDQEASPAVELFAQDEVGNSAAQAFSYRIQPRNFRPVTVKLPEEFLRKTIADLAEQNTEAIAKSAGRDLKNLFRAPVGGAERLIEQFRLVNTALRTANERQMSQLFSGPRFEKLWNGSFMRPSGSILQNYGDQLIFQFDGQELGRAFESGFEFSAGKGGADVYAVNDGIVAFTENVGIYGRVLGIDHGFGLFSVYARLAQSFVRKGEAVTKGQKIARAGSSGLSRNDQLLFEMRIQGVPVAPEEWWDETWFRDHIENKINNVKQLLGLPVLRPIN